MLIRGGEQEIEMQPSWIQTSLKNCQSDQHAERHLRESKCELETWDRAEPKVPYAWVVVIVWNIIPHQATLGEFGKVVVMIIIWRGRERAGRVSEV